jgi:hypothetical protein
MDKVATCVLTVGDDKLAVRDNNDILSEVAKGGAYAGRLGEVTQMGLDMERNI